MGIKGISSAKLEFYIFTVNKLIIRTLEFMGC